MQRPSATPSAEARTRIAGLGCPACSQSAAATSRPPTNAAVSAGCMETRAHPSGGLMPARRLTTTTPMKPSSPTYSSQRRTEIASSGAGGKFKRDYTNRRPRSPLLDDPAAQYARTRVEHRGLARRSAEERLVEHEAPAGVRRRDRGCVVAQARLASERLVCRAVDEAHVAQLDLAGCELLPPPHHQPVGRSVDFQHVPRAGLVQVAEPAALAHRVESRAAMAAELATRLVDHRTRAHGQALRQVSRGLAPRDEADLLALGLVGDGQPKLARVLAHLPLGHTAERKADPAEPLTVEVVEHVRLVFRGIGSGVELRSAVDLDDACVMTGGELVEAELQHSREHEVEADERIAAEAWVRSPPLEVVAMKGLDDPLTELGLEVPAVIRNAEQRRDPASVLDR